MKRVFFPRSPGHNEDLIMTLPKRGFKKPYATITPCRVPTDNSRGKMFDGGAHYS